MVREMRCRYCNEVIGRWGNASEASGFIVTYWHRSEGSSYIYEYCRKENLATTLEGRDMLDSHISPKAAPHDLFIPRYEFSGF